MKKWKIQKMILKRLVETINVLVVQEKNLKIVMAIFKIRFF